MQDWLIKLLVEAGKKGQAIVSLSLPGTRRECKLNLLDAYYVPETTNFIIIQSLELFF